MTRQEYEKELDKVIASIDALDSQNAGDVLNNMKGIYPVRLGVYYAEAKRQFQQDGDGIKVFQHLSGKITTSFKYAYNEACLDFYKEIQEYYNNPFDGKYYSYLKNTISDDFSHYESLYKACDDLLQNPTCEKDIELYQELFGCGEMLGYLIHRYARRIRILNLPPVWEVPWVNDLTNMGYLLQELTGQMDTPFVVMESDNNTSLVELVCDDLRLLRKKVYRITKPLVCAGEGINIEDTLAVSIEAMEQKDNLVTIVPVELIYENGKSVDNRALILEYINHVFNKDKQLNVLADGWMTDDLSLRAEVCKKIVRVTQYICDATQFNLQIFSYGSYLDYFTKIYNENCDELFSRKEKVRFSIIIPARNSSATLRYTLQTCLEQNYNGSYEIIVSDNSTGNNASVYNLCKELNDPRIVYLKTPRDLPLPKSFEYAYLHAKGEYILAVGSDDGVLPWALEALDDVINEYPNEEIIQWERGFYAWPGFNGGQQHQFVIPAKYEKGKYNAFYRKKAEYLASVFKDSANMYILPMLYINSCFKRSYFNTLLEKTGRLWDGICQDIYMGVVTASVHSQILNIRFPLTIAGMSSGSVGANANTGKRTNEEFDKLMDEVSKDNNMGGFAPSYYERLLPQTGTDTSSLYGSLLRIISFGILPKEYLEAFDWKRIFLQLAAELDIRDVAYDCKIHQMQYAASFHGEEFLDWFNEAIYEPGLTPRVIDEEKIKANAAKRKYSVGEAENGSLTLDASEYGVQNVYDAVQLFKRLMPL